jgi:hypothetical protein
MIDEKVAHTWNSGTQGTEAEESQVQDQPRLNGSDPVSKNQNQQLIYIYKHLYVTMVKTFKIFSSRVFVCLFVSLFFCGTGA